MDRDTETQLVQRARKGDATAYAQLIDAYQGRLYSVAFRLLASREDAEEVVQDVFVKAWKQLGRFKGDSAFYTWIYRIGVNTALSRLSYEKRRGRGKFLDLEDVKNENEPDPIQALPDGNPTPRERTEDADLDVRIHEEIQNLPADLRAVVVLRDIEGMAYETLAETLGLPLGTVKSRLHKGRLKLQQQLQPWLAE